MGRHVAGRLAAFRHRKAALFQTIAPGYFTSETECERGFREVLKKTGVEPQVVYHERDRDSLVRLLKRMFSAGDHATALVVINSLDYLTTTSFLTQKGLRVPEDVSVIARNDDAFMTALLPEPHPLSRQSPCPGPPDLQVAHAGDRWAIVDPAPRADHAGIHRR
jgi:DNA-binding LacI/PurR family transcriptional regulator